ncbi:DUF6049 family protein [Streptomyces sp. NPDC051940]|uniref:DUF6049 family protein n=1 Tax=Streptomyces sp. NPDC051940 TaxID=3155675 RepID=UPI0034454105
MAEAADNHGTTPSPVRRLWRAPRARRRQLAALVAALPVFAGLLQLPAAQPAEAAPTGSRAVDVSVNRVAPLVPAADDTVTISGTLTNKGKDKISDARVGLRMTGAPLDSRSAITDAAKRKDFTWQEDGNEVGGPGVKELKNGLAPGVTIPFSLRVPAKDLPTDGPGVYQLAVTVSGTTPDDQLESVRGIEHTFLPWQPSERSTRTGLTFLWPLISTPQLSARTDPDDVQTPYFVSDTLERELQPGGRLQVLLDQGRDLPVTWVIDPDLLASVNAMTSKHWVIDENGNEVAGTKEAQETARAWLKELQEAVQGGEVIALPFADTDLASIAHRADRSATTLKQLREATELAATTVESVLQVPARTDFSWPVAGALDPAVVDISDEGGADKVIARSDSLRESPDLSYTPTAARPIAGDQTAVVSDATLSRLFEGDMVDGDKSALAVQQFLAQTLMITLQAPNKARSIVVAPQRTPTASQAQTMAEALRGLSQQYWTTGETLTEAAEETPDPQANRTVPAASRYPKKLRAQELRSDTFAAIRRTQQELDDFQVVLTEPVRVIAPIGNALKRELSNQWRGDPNGATAYRAAVADELDKLTGSVQLIDKTDLTLSGNTGVIPVTVQNNLVQDVKGLKVRLTSSNDQRLQIVTGEQVVTVAGGRSTTVKFETKAKASGPYTITAQLFTPDGRTFGTAKTFKVEVTSITSTVLLVIGVGILLVVLAGVRMYSQRKRAAATEDSPGESGVEDDRTGSSDDTGPAAGAPTGTGEKVDR